MSPGRLDGDDPNLQCLQRLVTPDFLVFERSKVREYVPVADDQMQVQARNGFGPGVIDGDGGVPLNGVRMACPTQKLFDDRALFINRSDTMHVMKSACNTLAFNFSFAFGGASRRTPGASGCGRMARTFSFVAVVISFLCLHSTFLFGADAVEGRQDYSVGLNNANTMSAEFRVGASGNIGLALKFADGRTQTLTGMVKSDEMKQQVQKDGRKVTQSVPMPDGLIEFHGMGLNFRNHVRPHLARYTEAQQDGLIKKWDALPGAAQHWVSLEIRADRAGAELWMEGRYCGRAVSESKLADVIFRLEDGGAVRGERTFTRAPTGAFLPLDVRYIARPGVMENAAITLKPGMQQVGGAPMIVGQGSANADVGMAKEMQGSRFLETNEYTSRTGLDGMPESLHFSVPQAFYNRAWVLCAVDADAHRDPVLTARLTRFGTSGRGGAIADTTITLPRGDEKPGNGISQEGSVEYLAADGKKITTPLYLVRVDLKTGDILDLIADTRDPYAAMKIGPYLDFEFLGKCGGLEVQHDRRREPVASSTSAIHVFGVTLEKSPVELRLKQSQPGNIFHNDEKPETTFALRANAAGRYSLRWAITDVAGSVLAKHDEAVELASAGSETNITVPLAMPDVGWYGLGITLADAEGNTVLKHSGAFALLGRDTRTAGYESPFGTWWFNGVHYTTRDIDVAGPLLFKAGFRRTTMGWTKADEADLASWKVSVNQIGWQFRLVDLKDWPAAEARVEKSISAMLKRFPHCQYALLFHESYDAGAFPPELYGEKYVAKDAALVEREDQLYELGLKGARFLRAKFPQLKIIAGNSGGSSGIVAVMLRRGFPRDLIDYLGSETTGQTFAPEKLTPHTTAGIWLMGETARKLGYDIPLTGCYEFTSRAERDLGAQRQAEWYTRDVLIGLANRFPTISPAGIEDVGNAYYDTLWGASGLCERNPLHYPKPGYVALATLTKTLDSVKLVRQMPTGSASAYALEFERGSEHIYALWTPRGQCEMAFEFPADAAVMNVGFYGKETQLKTSGKKLMITSDCAVSYLISPTAALRVAAGRRAFPTDRPAADTQVVSRMDDVTQWRLAPDDQPLTTSLQRPGKFELRQVDDSEKGKCVELELKREGDIPNIVGEYTALRLKEPAIVPGKPHTVGIWVKGDSSWGRMFWEIEDARGARWRSSGGFEGGDWGDHAAINFDGWCLVTFPLTNESPAVQIEPNSGRGQWQHTGNGKMAYPLKLTGLYVLTHRDSLDLTKMQPVKGHIRLKDVSVIGSGAAENVGSP